MTDTIIIEVDKETMNFMEALHFDINAYMHIMKTILVKNEIMEQENYHYNEETYNLFMKEYRELYMKYETAKKEILNLYVPEQHKALTFNFNFERSRLESTAGGSCNGCNC